MLKRLRHTVFVLLLISLLLGVAGAALSFRNPLHYQIEASSQRAINVEIAEGKVCVWHVWCSDPIGIDDERELFDGRSHNVGFATQFTFRFLWRDRSGPYTSPRFVIVSPCDRLGTAEDEPQKSYNMESTHLVFPLWASQGLMFLALVPCAIRGYSRFRRTRNRAVCPNCAYNLTGNESGVCPECGGAVEAAA
ncbi:MAG TPA: hypothetical protein P5081_22135 [Phycisphaerae bacterium]|nr:hypothetical protein [Phycisphaerae bacterium]HRW55581.1 hypothetical protein [Phycisphaerae bacterium]